MKKGIFGYIEKVRQFNREAKLFLLMIFLSQLLNGAYRVVFNLYLDTLGFSSDIIGSVASVRLIVGAILGIPLGIMATRIGYRKSLLLIGSLTFFCILGIANSTSQTLLFFFSTLWGVAFVLRGIMTAPFLARFSNPEERNHLFGVTFSLQMGSSMLGSFLGGSITTGLQQFFHLAPKSAYNYTLNSLVLIALVSLIPVFLLQKDPGLKTSRRGLLQNVGKVFQYPDMKKFLFYSVLIGSGAGLVVPLFNLFLRARLNASDFQIGTLISVTQIATSVGCLMTPYLVRIFGKIKSVVVSQFLSVPFLIIVGGVGYFPIVAVAYFLRTSLMNMVNPIVSSTSMDIVEENEQAAASSLIRTFRSMGRGIGVYFSGILLANESYMLPFILTCVLYLSGSLVFFFAFRGHPAVEQEKNSAVAR